MKSIVYDEELDNQRFLILRYFSIIYLQCVSLRYERSYSLFIADKSFAYEEYNPPYIVDTD